MDKDFSSPRKIVVELLFLAALLFFAAWFVVPVCWTVNAKNIDYTGWCVSLSKILDGGGKFYVNGTHVPLSPLPFIALHAVAPANKALIHESVASYFCLSL